VQRLRPPRRKCPRRGPCYMGRTRKLEHRRGRAAFPAARFRRRAAALNMPPGVHQNSF
jgi:hypothetical protein